MRRQVWDEMDEDARRSLFERGLSAIFDPELQQSIAALVADVRARGDAAVCDALARYDGIEVAPDGLRVSADELESATVTADVNAAIDDAIAHLRATNHRGRSRVATIAVSGVSSEGEVPVATRLS